MRHHPHTAPALLWSALLGFGGGCASSPPPVSSLPGTGEAAIYRPDPESPQATPEIDVPAAVATDETSRTLPTPDPDSGAGTLLIYTAITGHRPFNSNAPRTAGSGTDHWAHEDEAARGRALETEIERELRRRESAASGGETASHERPTIESLITGEALAVRANPRIAPDTPIDREIPMPLFDFETVTILAGSWENAEAFEVRRGTLDADADGAPEQIRYFDPESDALLRVDEDSNFDGQLDTWSTYDNAELTTRVLDTNHDGIADVWEQYAGGRMTERTIDRNRDGVVDAFYRYQGNTLAEERHDSNDDGTVDFRVTYKNLYRVASEEDRDRNGKMDTWTTYGLSNGEEVVLRVEHASTGGGAPDVVETYDISSGRSVLALREEDRNGDGSVDVTSRYRNGKLVEREIADPDLAPL